MKSTVIFLLTSVVLFSNSFAQNNNMNKKTTVTIKKPEAEFVPEWAKKVVWYQIFPDRFRNGDKKNDPTLESIEGAYPHDIKSPWKIHPWTSDWYKLQPYEKKNGKDIWYNIQRRRYGGDIKGIMDKLDYLQDLGIGAIYLNPVFESPSSHKYDAATYHHIDPYLGPNPEKDKKLIAKEIPDDPSTWVWTTADKLFLKLIKEVHKRGMKIIIDGVFNHMGLNSWAFKDVVKNQQKSKYKDWFKIISWDDSVKGTKFNYHGWAGVKELPELKQDKNGITDGPKKYIFNITKRWMDPNGDGVTSDGIDGWRLDVAFLIKHNFWKDWRKFVKSVNPQAYLTAEIIDPVDKIKPFLQGDEFDAVMNYNFLFNSAEYFADSVAIVTTAFNRRLKKLRDAFPGGVAYVQQNLFDSHDTQRLASLIVNKDKYGIREWSSAFNLTKGSNPDYDTRKPDAEEIKLMKLMLIFQMTYVGAPYVYYGDEAGMWGANDPDCRKPMVWPDMKYEPEQYLPDQRKRERPDTVVFNKDLFEFYKKLIHIRNEYPELQLGNFVAIAYDDKAGVFVYERNYKGKQIMVALNKGKQNQIITLYTDKHLLYTDLLNKKRKVRSAGGRMVFSLHPMEGRILSRGFYKGRKKKN